ncbi:hypothetical protein NA78x_000294 [Anatilimnocola sp. NA78]|uniref:hypothetical protein n=1 Tax=Anatilimnocola sp. NA78 TaxID=3415683 RepID=UPI003CE4D03B
MAESLLPRLPLDPFPYDQDPRSRILDSTIASGAYVYVRDSAGILHVLPDGPHLHPKILGGGLPATYAGELTIINGVATEVTNCSGTFQFDEREGLRTIAQQVTELGLHVGERAVRFFPLDGGPIEILE